jgi:hypothetical protein
MDHVKGVVAINDVGLPDTDVPVPVNVSREADVAFLAELKRSDRPRWNRLMDAMQKQAYANQRKAA